MAEYELYCFKESGNAFKAAIMLELAGCDWSATWVDFFNGETRTPEYRENVNVMGEVPVLKHGDVQLSQTGLILTYLAEQTGKFGGRNKEEEREILRWILFDNHKLTASVAVYRFTTFFLKDVDKGATNFLQGRMIAALKILETHLTGREFVVGDRATIADLSLCGYLFWPDEFGVTWDDYPAIGAWLDRIAALPGFVAPYDLLPSSAT